MGFRAPCHRLRFRPGEVSLARAGAGFRGTLSLTFLAFAERHVLGLALGLTLPLEEKFRVRFRNVLRISNSLGIPVKVNIDSGGKPNGIPERR